MYHVVCKIRPPPQKKIVWLSSTTFLEQVRAGRFFFSKSKSNLHGIIASLSPNEGVNTSTLPKNIFLQILNQFYICKQVDNNNLKNIFKRLKFSKKKKNFGGNSENKGRYTFVQ